MKLQLTLPDIFQNQMILQRNKPIPVWGQCNFACNLTITLGVHTVTCIAKESAFSCTLPAMDAATDLTLSIFEEGCSTPTIRLEHIAMGDIWLAGGQSNMEFFLRYEAHWNETRKLPTNPLIRMYNCPRIAFEGQQRDLPDSGYWFDDQDAALASFSAPAYHFARTLQPSLNIPIGIIGCNWGGTPARAWVDRAYLDTPDLRFYLEEYEHYLASQDLETLKKESVASWECEDSYHRQMEWRPMMYGLTEAEQQEWITHHNSEVYVPLGPYHHYRPCGLYENMIMRIAPFSIKGVLWYQGESDEDHPDIYDQMLAAVIQCWRDTFQDEKLPFLLVQLAPFQKWLECYGKMFPLIRQKQDIAAHTIPDTYLTSIMDIGMYEDIHPKEKREVGRRLALLAQNHVYGINCLSDPPELVSTSRENGTLRLTFANAGDGLSVNGQEINALEISQSGQPCTIQNYSIAADTITIYSNVLSPEPVDICYAEQSYCEVNLYNSACIPAKPFHRTV